MPQPGEYNLTTEQPVQTEAKPASESEGARAVAASAHGSADALKKEYQTGYSRGYASAMNRVRKLEAEIARLRQLKIPPEVDGHDSCIEYLLTTSEVFTKAADVMIRMRIHDNPPNADLRQDADSATSNAK